MKLFLVRHAEAESGPQLDPTRELTSTGKRQARMMGRWLARQADVPALVIESNMRRSQQTAKRVAKRIDAPIERTYAIDPDGTPEKAIAEIKRLADAAGADSVLAVTHGPLVEQIMAYLTYGSRDSFHFAHCSIAHFDDAESLHWLVSPNTVARDEDEMDAIAEAAVQVARKCIRIVESLQHPKHAAALAPQRAAMAALMMRRWRKQRARLLKAPGLHAWLSTHTTLAAHEADTDLRARLQSSVEAHINGTGIFQSEADDRDIAVYDRIVTGTMGAAAERMRIDYEITMAREKGQEAVATYLQELGFSELASDIDAATRERITNALVDVFEGGGTYQDAVAAIKGGIVDQARADMIARTELNAAYNQSMLASAREVEGAKKEWSPDGECCEEICQPNVDAGVIDLDEDFPSGDDAPPAHPNCDCSVSFIFPKR